MKNNVYKRYYNLLIFCFLFFSINIFEIQALPLLTPEQQELIKQLPPEQQSAVLKNIQSKNNIPENQPKSTEDIINPVIIIPKNKETQNSPIEKQIEAPQRLSKETEKKLQGAPESLKQFGYELFAGSPTTFAPATDIPVPTDYIVGPGDTIQVQLFGKENIIQTLTISREGELNFPNIGPISVAGMKFSELREHLTEIVTRKMIGNKINVTMGKLRSIRILILGEAERPGSYTISALSTLTNALLVSGGVKSIGSLRNIQLKRNGQVVVTMDLYDLLLRGDTDSDVRLAPGDVIFVPTIGSTVGIAGAVHRPAIYEIKNEKNITDILKLSGGPLPIAYLQGSQLERINKNSDRVVINIDLRNSTVLASPIHNGDLLRISSVLDRFQDTVTLQGHVYRPGQVQWYQGMRLTDLIKSEKELLPRPDTHYVIVRRELPNRSIEALTVDLGKALAYPKSVYNIKLAPMDEIQVFGLDEDRRASLSPLVTQLRHQTNINQSEPTVTIHEGQVRYPGTYPLVKNMRLVDLIIGAGGLLPNTDLDFTIIRRETNNGQRIEVLTTILKEAIASPNGKFDLLLMPRDQIHIFGINEDRQTFLLPLISELRRQSLTSAETPEIEISGAVLKPGIYPLTKEMRLRDLVKVGILSEAAYTLNAELTRNIIVNGLSREIEYFSVDLAAVLDGDQNADLLLKPYDKLTIRQIPKWYDQETVEILGEVNFPGIYAIQPGETLISLLSRAGNFTTHASLRGAVLTRRTLIEHEKRLLDDLANRMESNLASVQLSKTQTAQEKRQASSGEGSQALNIGYQLLKQLRNTAPIGRLVIDLPELFSGPKIANMGNKRYAELNVILKGGDRLFIPKESQEVIVMGEVNYPTSHIFQEGLDRDDYIAKSGGITQNGNKKQIYIIQANGSVVTNESGIFGGWFPSISGNKILQPGDSIVVPLDVDKIQPLAFWSEVTKIMYEIALSAAAMKTVGAL